MSLENISDSELNDRILILTSKEREISLKFLVYLGEFDKRKLYLGQGYSSLFDYCCRKLKFSESSAFRRMESARCLREHPELKESFLNGAVSMCTIATAARAIREKKTQPTQIIGKSKSEIQALLAVALPVEKPIEKIRAIAVKMDIAAPDKNLGVVKTAVREAEIEQAELRYEIKFSVKKEIMQKLETAKARLSNKLGADLSIENIFGELLEHYIADPKPRKVSKTNNNTRYVSAFVKREVLKRDNCRCSYISSNEIRCTETKYLHLDHIKPFAIGGRSNLENLRVLCSAHNRVRISETFPEARR